MITELRQDHVHFDRLLALLTEESAALHSGGSPDYELLADGLAYLAGYANQVHHPCEDLIFACCLQRDPSQAGQLRAIFSEHRRMEAAASALHTDLDGLLHGAIASREDLMRKFDDLVQQMDRHMRLEDEILFPHALQVLTEADWARLEGEYPVRDDPLFGQQRLQAEFRSLYQRIMGQPETTAVYGGSRRGDRPVAPTTPRERIDSDVLS